MLLPVFKLKAGENWWISGAQTMSPIKLLQQTVSWPLRQDGEECEPLDWKSIFGSSSESLTLPGSCLNHIQCLESCHVLKHWSTETREQSVGQTESLDWTHSGNTLRCHWQTHGKFSSQNILSHLRWTHTVPNYHTMRLIHCMLIMCLSLHNLYKNERSVTSFNSYAPSLQWIPRFKAICSKLWYRTWHNV